MKFAMFFLGEYASMITVSALAATLFFGGWSGPILPPVVWFLLKMSVEVRLAGAFPLGAPEHYGDGLDCNLVIL